MGGVIPKEYIPAVDKGVQEQIANGVLAGYPVVDVKVTVYDGSYLQDCRFHGIQGWLHEGTASAVRAFNEGRG